MLTKFNIKNITCHTNCFMYGSYRSMVLLSKDILYDNTHIKQGIVHNTHEYNWTIPGFSDIFPSNLIKYDEYKFKFAKKKTENKFFNNLSTGL